MFFFFFFFLHTTYMDNTTRYLLHFQTLWVLGLMIITNGGLEYGTGLFAL